MARKKPEDQSQTEPTNAHGRRMPATKTEAVKMAIAAGFDSPQVGSGYIQSQFGLDVSPQHFSSTKSQLKGKMLETGSKPERDPKVEIEHAPTPKRQARELDILAAIEKIKPLVEALGAEKVKKIADLLA